MNHASTRSDDSAILIRADRHDADDEPSIGPGWYESTRDLLLGATVRELDSLEEAMTA